MATVAGTTIDLAGRDTVRAVRDASVDSPRLAVAFAEILRRLPLVRTLTERCPGSSVHPSCCSGRVRTRLRYRRDGAAGQHGPIVRLSPWGAARGLVIMDGMTEVRVLVVDDQEPYRRAMAAVVEATDGFAVVGVVGTGEESLDAVAALHPSLVLMDVNLPGISGVEAAGRMREADGAGPVVVLLSTYDEDEFDRSDAGTAAYVSKASFSPERLRQVWQESRG
jgi:two-component system response regulator AlgR